MRVRLEAGSDLGGWLQELRERERAVRPFEQTPLMHIQQWASVPSGQALFQSLLVFDYESLNGQMKGHGARYANREFDLIEQTNYPLTLYVYAESSLLAKLAYDEPRYDRSIAGQLLASLSRVLEDIAGGQAISLDELSVCAREDEARLLRDWNDTRRISRGSDCIHRQIEEQADRTPDRDALLFRQQRISYADLNARANRLAFHLMGLGVGPEVPVAVCARRKPDLVVALLAVHKAGGCYVPLDPTYPADRIAYMLQDCDAPVLITESPLIEALPETTSRVVLLDDEATFTSRPAHNPASAVGAENLAYIMYTSGSTGRPKGVMVEHRNVVNFFQAMDERLGIDVAKPDDPGTWLAVTSYSFDISVLELLWTLARGFRVALHEDQQAQGYSGGLPASTEYLDFSLMFFSSAATAGTDKYRLLLDSARYADSHGFSAIWTPERHFHDFGGLYPNPSVISAALAAVTNNLKLRSGSVVAPLHHPARIAEEWSVVDNLSNGRVGVSFASGWQPRDFVLAPDEHENARSSMLRVIDQVRRLWRGDSIEYPGPNGVNHAVQTSPRPIQPELPVWLTAAGSPETFREAGAMGAGLLTHLLGQTYGELEEKLKIYRDAWRSAGHPGNGHVTLMLHSFVGEDRDAVKEVVREPLKAYLASSLSLVKGFAQTWTAFKKGAGGDAGLDLDLDSLTEEEMAGLLEYSFERYYETSGLFGDVGSALQTVERVRLLGVDEIACLIDFGVPEDKVLEHLVYLNRVREQSQPNEIEEAVHRGSVGEQITDLGVTHLQCTPSLASMLIQDDSTRLAMGALETLLVGGEALPPELAGQLRELGVGRLLNMYGPTETTIWSAVHDVSTSEDPMPIGRPIANTTVYVLDERGRLMPPGLAGELYIGGRGVVRGYFGRGDLTAERFVPDPFGDEGERLYRTGDRVRWRHDGVLEFLGRVDHQVKIRGHRIELGEVETTMVQLGSVREAVVIAREDAPGDVRLVGYFIPESGAESPSEADFKRWLRSHLPEAMVPAHFVEMAAWPQTPNRKIDRKALPAPERRRANAGQQNTAASASCSELERKVAEVWADVLNVDFVDPDENFFDLGGHSLLAVKTQRKLTEMLDQPVAITDLFRFPTVRTLADHLAGGIGPSLDRSRRRGASRRQALADRRRRPSR